MKTRWWLPALVLAGGAALVWPHRHALTAEAIAAWPPRQAGLAAAFLLALYAVKSLSVAFPLSALAAAGGLLFPLPAALAVNLAGVGVVHTAPYLLGRRQQGDLAALAARYPRLEQLTARNAGQPERLVFLLRLGGASPGDLVSFCLGAAGVPWGRYLPPGLLGSAPRVAASTVLGAALWDIGGAKFWCSLAFGWGLTGVSLLLWRKWRA